MKKLKIILAYLLVFSLVLSYSFVPSSATTVTPADKSNGKVIYLGYDVYDSSCQNPLTPNSGNYSLDESQAFYIMVKFAGNPTDISETMTSYSLVLEYNNTIARVADAYFNAQLSAGSMINGSLNGNNSNQLSVIWTGPKSGLTTGTGFNVKIVDKGNLFAVPFIANSATLSSDVLDSFLKLVPKASIAETTTKALDGNDKQFTIKEAPAIDKVELNSTKAAAFTTKSSLDDIKAAITSFTYVNEAVEMVSYANNDDNSTVYNNLSLAVKGGGNLVEGKNTITATYEGQTFDFEITCAAAKYTVAYNANNGSGTTMTSDEFTFGTNKKLSKNTYTRDGYKFLGWSKDQNAESATYTDEQEITEAIATNAGDTVNLYAVWEEKTTLSGTDFTVTNNSPTFDNSSKKATVEFKNTLNPAPIGDITVTYWQNSTKVENPTAVGSYDICVTVAGDDNYKAVTQKIKVGTLTIGAKTPAFTLSEGHTNADNQQNTTEKAKINGTTTFNILTSDVSTYQIDFTVAIDPAVAGASVSKGDAPYKFTLTLTNAVEVDTIIPVKITIPAYNYVPAGGSADATAETAEVSKTIYIKAAKKSTNNTSGFSVSQADVTYGDTFSPSPSNKPTNAGDVTYTYYSVSQGSNDTLLNNKPTNAGSYKVVATCEDNDYIYEASDTFAINKKEVTIKANDVTNAIYGTKHTSFSNTPNGIISGETFAGKVTGNVTYKITNSSGDVTYAAGTPVGTYNIVPDVSGLSADNYTFKAENGTLTINPKPIKADDIVFASTPNSSKVYDATTEANASFELKTGVKVGEDGIGISVNSQSYNSAAVGDSKTITAVFSLSGTNKENYTLNDGTNDVATLSKEFSGQITKKNLANVTNVSVPAQAVYIKTGEFTDPVYTLVLKEGATSTNPEFSSSTGTFTYSGKVGDTTLTAANHASVETAIKALTNDTNISLTFTFTPTDNVNFENALTGSLTLNAANMAFYVGDETQEILSSDNVNQVITASSTVNYGKTWAEIITSPSVASSNTAFDNVSGITAKVGSNEVPGTYVIDVDPTIKPDSGSKNYCIKFSATDSTKYPDYQNYTVYTGTVTVNKISQDATVSMKDFIVGNTPEGPSISGECETPTVTYYYNTSNNTTNGTAWTNETGATLEVGTYYMYANLSATTNFNETVTDTVDFKVKAKEEKTDSKFTISQGDITYGETVNPQVTNTLTGVGSVTTKYYTKQSDGSYADESVNAPTDAGSYKVVAKCEDSTYVYVAEKKFDIKKKELEITAGNINATYGDTAKNLTNTIEGYVNSHQQSDVIDGSVTYTIKDSSNQECQYTASIDAGTYSIIPSATIKNNNYKLKAVNGTLTIAKKPITSTNITFTSTPNSSKVYDATTKAYANYELASDIQVNSDSIGISVDSQEYDTKDVGNSKNINAVFSLSGTDKGNYTLNNGTGNVETLAKSFTGSITAKDLSTVNSVTAPEQAVYINAGTFTDPEYTLVLVEGAETNPVFNNTTGTFTYSGTVGNATLTNATHAEVVTAIQALTSDKTLTLTFEFAPNDTTNFTNKLSGSLSLVASSLAFYLGTTSNLVSADNINQVITYSSTVDYGKSWSQIITSPGYSQQNGTFEYVSGITAKVGTTAVPGTFKLDVNATTVPAVGSKEFTIKFYPDDATTYSAYNGHVVYTGAVTVNPAFQNVTVSMSNYTVGKTPSVPEISGLVGSPTVTYYYNTTDSTVGGQVWDTANPPTLEKGTYYMYAVIGADGNYKETVTNPVQFNVKSSGLVARILEFFGIGSSSSGDSFISKVTTTFKNILKALDIFHIFS